MNDLKNGHFLIAAGTVFFLLIMLGAVMGVHMFGYVNHLGEYTAPPEFWWICKCALGASVTILTLGGIARWRHNRDEADDDDEYEVITDADEETNSGSD